MAGGADQGDHAAAGRPDEHRPGDVERGAERGHVVGPLLPSPLWRDAAVGPARAALVEVDHLGGVGHRGELGLEQGVVDAGPAVQEQQGGALGHRRARRDETRALHVEVQPEVADGHAHAAMMPRTPHPGAGVDADRAAWGGGADHGPPHPCSDQ
jgi:hypothetical protein